MNSSFINISRVVWNNIAFIMFTGDNLEEDYDDEDFDLDDEDFDLDDEDDYD